MVLSGAMKLPNLKVVGVIGFIALAAIATALGCPFFRNPTNYASAGGFFGSLRYLADIHRKKR